MSAIDNEYKQQCQEWHEQLLPEFRRNNTRNLNERLNEIEKIVNKKCDHFNRTNFAFKVDEKQRHRLTYLWNKDIREHTAVSIRQCVVKMKTIDDYKTKARNKLNRWKPKVLGTHVLYQIIFINIYNVCVRKIYFYSK